MNFESPKVRVAAAAAVFLVGAAVLTVAYLREQNEPLVPFLPQELQEQIMRPKPAEEVGSSMHYTFNVDGTLNETASMEQSRSAYFWLNSGGRLYIRDGVGMTVQGSLESGILWQLLYAKNNSLDTESGYFPQNLFRLVTRSTWDNVREEVRFNIQSINMTDTPNRDGWSGVFLMSRYQNGDNLYYAGIRMDGAAVIKKKYRGTYYTLAQEPLPYATSTYNRRTNPNLIPEDTWMRIRSDTETRGDGREVRVTMYLDTNDDGVYDHRLQAFDRIGAYGSDVVRGPAYAGIRTDYLDVLFDDYSIREIVTDDSAAGGNGA